LIKKFYCAIFYPIEKPNWRKRCEYQNLNIFIHPPLKRLVLYSINTKGRPRS
jgi:hypothetical protein